MGEEPRSVGFEAEDVAINFIRSLGYEIQEAPNEEFGLDVIAEFPPIIGFRGLKRPLFSFSGLTAFEIKSQVASRSKVTTFAGKIARYNQRTDIRKISGGIFFIDRRISNPILVFMESHGIFGWDSRRISFYENKLRIYNDLVDNGITTEIQIEKCTSYLRCFSPSSEDGILLHFSVFVDDHCHAFSSSRAKEIMEKIRLHCLSPLVDLGYVPLETSFEFHSLGGGRDPCSDLSLLRLDWKTLGINVNFGPYRSYRAFPQLARAL